MTRANPLLEDDMARIDQARDTVEDLQALAMRLARRPVVSAEDIARMVTWALRLDEALASAQRMGVTMAEMAELLRTFKPTTKEAHYAK